MRGSAGVPWWAVYSRLNPDFHFKKSTILFPRMLLNSWFHAIQSLLRQAARFWIGVAGQGASAQFQKRTGCRHLILRTLGIARGAEFVCMGKLGGKGLAQR